MYVRTAQLFGFVTNVIAETEMSSPVVKTKFPVHIPNVSSTTNPSKPRQCQYIIITNSYDLVTCKNVAPADPPDLGAHKNGSQGRAKRLAGCTIFGGGCHVHPRPPIFCKLDEEQRCKKRHVHNC